MFANFHTKRTTLTFGPKCTQKLILGSQFPKLSLDSESAHPRNHVSRFSVKMDNFEFSGLNLPNYVRYFGSNIAEGVAESWVEVEMSQLEVDGAGWSWVHGSVIPFIFYLLLLYSSTNISQLISIHGNFCQTRQGFVHFFIIMPKLPLGSRAIAPQENCPSHPNFNANLKTNPSPKWNAIFLGCNCPDTQPFVGLSCSRPNKIQRSITPSGLKL